MFPDIEKIKEITKELQGIMRIQDWDISVEIVNEREMDSIAKDDYVPGGYCHRNRYYKTAKISLNKDYKDSDVDWYYILIHELYHVVLEDMGNYWDNEVKDKIDSKYTDELDQKFSFYIEKLDCDLTRQFCRLCPVGIFIKEDD